MHCFFNLVRGQEVIRDETGVNVWNLEQARRDAVQAINDLLRNEPGVALEEGWTMECADESGAVLFTISIAEEPPAPPA